MIVLFWMFCKRYFTIWEFALEMCGNIDFSIEGTQKLWVQVQQLKLMLLTLVQQTGWENTGMLYLVCINACFELLRAIWCGGEMWCDSACVPRGAVCEIPGGALVVLCIPAAPAVLGNGSPGAVFNNRSCFLWLSACLHVILHCLFIDSISFLLVTVLILLLPVPGFSLQLNSLWIFSYFWQCIRPFQGTWDMEVEKLMFQLPNTKIPVSSFRFP